MVLGDEFLKLLKSFLDIWYMVWDMKIEKYRKSIYSVNLCIVFISSPFRNGP